jgi:hypothetical protein
MEPISDAPMPDPRPHATREALKQGTRLGSLRRTLTDAEPQTLLSLSNEILMGNFQLEPWIHAASEIRNYSTASPGSTVDVRGRIVSQFERKGYEYVALDIQVWNGFELIQTVRHTAIYALRPLNARA